MTALPGQFSDLQPLADRWALPTTQQRLELRASSTMDELRAFYDHFAARAEQVFEFLDGQPAGEERLPDDVRQLLRLTKAFMDTGVAIELLDAPDEPHVCAIDRLRLDP